MPAECQLQSTTDPENPDPFVRKDQISVGGRIEKLPDSPKIPEDQLKEEAISLFLQTGSQYGWARGSGKVEKGYEDDVAKDFAYGSLRPPVAGESQPYQREIRAFFFLNVPKALDILRASKKTLDTIDQWGSPEDLYTWFYNRIVRIEDIPNIVPEVERAYSAKIECLKRLEGLE